MKQVLTIAASDPGGGAGIQGDLKALHANGVYALSALVALTAQNTQAVSLVHPLPKEIIEAQLDALFEDFEISAVKTGMLYSKDIVRIVADKLRQWKFPHLVVDPVMLSKGGQELLQTDAVKQSKKDLFPLAELVTPNIPEAQDLAGMEIHSLKSCEEAARRIHQLGCHAVLVKGGHLASNPATDLLYDGEKFTVIEGEYIQSPHTHGTGCTYSAAIAAHLALGKGLTQAVQAAKAYITEAIRHGLAIGQGQGPTHHFFFLKPPF